VGGSDRTLCQVVTSRVSSREKIVQLANQMKKKTHTNGRRQFSFDFNLNGAPFFLKI
jgi:hypothetical protein